MKRIEKYTIEQEFTKIQLEYLDMNKHIKLLKDEAIDKINEIIKNSNILYDENKIVILNIKKQERNSIKFGQESKLIRIIAEAYELPKDILIKEVNNG